jgi:hypothetical protein
LHRPLDVCTELARAPQVAAHARIEIVLLLLEAVALRALRKFRGRLRCQVEEQRLAAARAVPNARAAAGAANDASSALIRKRRIAEAVA